LTTRHKLGAAGVLVTLAVLILAALVLPQSFRLTAFSDVIQCLLLAAGTAAFVPRILESQGRLRFFWSLISFGIALWFAYQLMWTYYEVLLHKDVPDLFAGDVVLFLHIVPFMAALALRPHIPRDEYAARLGQLDFALLIVWWFYLYVLIVIPWQYAVPDATTYNHNLNAVYLAEKIAFLGALAACWAGSKGRWRTLYASLLAANVIYAASSYLANWAIARKLYYSGSLYDVPLAVSIASLALIGLWTKAETPEAGTREVSTVYGVWIARCSMIAVFSLPAFAAWTLLDDGEPIRVRSFRLLLTLMSAFVMGIMVFVRQHLLDRELMHLLDHSRESFGRLEHLQAQLLQSEKLASVGQLVGGAAHELNNPITAMLGYSDLLLSTELTPDQRPVAAKIGQQVRRTKSLVASLVSFAKHAPPAKTPVDLNTLLRTAVKLTQSHCEALNVGVRLELDKELPKVLGDSNQLLQVCLQLLNNFLHSMEEQDSKVLIVGTRREDGNAVMQIATATPSTVAPRANLVGSDVGEDEDIFGLSACRGIVQEHGGQICGGEHEDGIVEVRVELPITNTAPSKTKESTVPVLWQSQSFS
jgi:signal transduction histidine kinase